MLASPPGWQYLSYFPRDQLLIIKSEDLQQARAATLRRIHEFLGVAPDWIPAGIDREFPPDDRQTDAATVAADHAPASRVSGHRAHRPVNPERVKTRVFMRPIEPREWTIPGGLRGRLAGMLRDDVRRLRRYFEDDFDGWGLG